MGILNKKFHLVIVLSIVSLIILEIVVRLVFNNATFSPRIFKQTNTGEYELLANKDQLVVQFGKEIRISTNEDGHRITSHLLPNSELGNLHLVGDSQVFGWGLDNSQTIGFLLHSKLNGSINVINHGMPGLGPTDYIRIIESLPRNEPVIIFLTEENDLWDLYRIFNNVKIKCGYMSNGHSFLADMPCALKESRALQLYLELKATKKNLVRPTPIGFSENSTVAGRVLMSRMDETLTKIREKRTGPVYIAVIPWKGRYIIDEKEQYLPKPAANVNDRGFSQGNFGIVEAFKHSSGRLYLNGDSHISPIGAKVVVEQLIKELSKRNSILNYTSGDK